MPFEDDRTAALTYVGQSLALREEEKRRLDDRVWCFSAKVRQPRKDDGTCNRTPFFDRWDLGPTSHLTTTDARYADQPTCERTYLHLVLLLLESDGGMVLAPEQASFFESKMGRPFVPNNLRCVVTTSQISANDIKRALGYVTPRLGAYDIPVSYIRELNDGGTHRESNVGWMKPIHIIYSLRTVLKSSLRASGADAPTANTVLDKIQVKAYCTDKVTMPPHYSNRDIRWATWPDSIQYASHYNCAMIELVLMSQLYEFQDAPVLDAIVSAQLAASMGRDIRHNSARCFVTGKLLSFSEYVQAAVNPHGGRSAYHVGHLHPLTRGGRHKPDNIQWAGDDGNRIQGNDTIEEIEGKLLQAVQYHLERDSATPNANLAAKAQSLWETLNEVRRRLGKAPYEW